MCCILPPRRNFEVMQKKNGWCYSCVVREKWLKMMKWHAECRSCASERLNWSCTGGAGISESWELLLFCFINKSCSPQDSRAVAGLTPGTNFWTRFCSKVTVLWWFGCLTAVCVCRAELVHEFWQNCGSILSSFPVCILHLMVVEGGGSVTEAFWR